MYYRSTQAKRPDSDALRDAEVDSPEGGISVKNAPGGGGHGIANGGQYFADYHYDDFEDEVSSFVLLVESSLGETILYFNNSVPHSIDT